MKFYCTCGHSVFVGPDVTQTLACSKCGELIEIDTKADNYVPAAPQVVTVEGPPNVALDGTALTAHWDAVHQYPVDRKHDWHVDEAKVWYRNWLKELPTFGCSCEASFSLITAVDPPDFRSASHFAKWGVRVHNTVNHKLGKPRMLFRDAERRYRFPNSFRGLVQHLITWEEFTADTLLLGQQILDRHPNLAGIAGAPRSGMRAACELALRFGLPLYEISEKNGLKQLGAGLRMGTSELHGTPAPIAGDQIVMIEDSISSGHSINLLRTLAPELPIYAVYGGEARSKLNGYGVALNLPHWFEWNFWHNGAILRSVGIDWDGVLNEDCTQEEDDDGPRYLAWMDAVKPIRTPRRYKVPVIITARREAYREQCEAWLARYGINYGKLVMFPGTFAERTEVWKWKAAMCEEHHVEYYVESSLFQARRISKILGRAVLSIERP